ncbi:hypothetical protein ABZ490_31305 [Streptomyces sp. NPDC005811]|uniref:hypothetical protein n=1 Tax=Streptomyces sp. NPDC005811 TaxID=3154565 RepID=UPI0033ECD05A
MNDARPEDGVAVLDLRPPPGRPADPAATGRALREQLGRTRLGGYGPRRLLLLDTAEGLTAHPELYERVMAYPAQTAPRVLCVVVGDPAPAQVPGRRLRLPTVLRTAGAGVLWVSDPQCGAEEGHDHPPGDEAAVALLVELLGPPELFDEVLDAVLGCPSATAALSARVLAYDLPADARDRAWHAALARFAGDPAARPPADGADLEPAELPRTLAELLSAAPGRSADRLLRPGGPAAADRDACAGALSAADAAWSDLARPLALLTGGAAAQALPRAVEDASHALRRYREVVTRVLREGGAPGVPAAESAAVLDRLGVTPPAAARSTAPTAQSTEEELGAFTLGLLSRGLALHTVAGRLTSLSERVAPVPAAGLAARLDRRSPDESGGVGVSHPFHASSAGPGRLTGIAALVALAGVARWPGTLLALLPVLVLLVGGALAAARRPKAAVRGPIRQYAVPRAVAAAVGAAGGFLLGRALDPPLWAGALGAAVAALVCAVLCCADWVRAVDDWCEGTGLAVLREELDRVDSVLAEAMRQQWWAADERTRCADSARALAVVLRRSAAEAHDGRTASGAPAPGPAGPPDAPERGVRQEDAWTGEAWPDGDWSGDPWHEGAAGSAGPWSEERPHEEPAPPHGTWETAPGDDRPAGPGTPPWLVHTSADGGPELLPTLVADLADATVDALRRFWGVAAPAPSAHRHADTLANAVRDGFGTARRHLELCGVMAAPPFTRPGRGRGDAMALLGSGVMPVRDALAPEAADRLRSLCSPAQLPLLSRDPMAMRVIRFAPRAVRTTLGTVPAAESDDAVWMSSGRLVGALRVTALRPGAVETVRVRVRPPDDDGPGDRPGDRLGDRLGDGPGDRLGGRAEHNVGDDAADRADSGLSHGDSGGASW